MKHEHITYSCDRCKANLGAELPQRNQGASVVASFNWRDGPGDNFKWNDLCDDCDRAIKTFFLGIKEQPTQTEKAESRIAVTEMLGWANTEKSDYICVRILRLFGGKINKHSTRA